MPTSGRDRCLRATVPEARHSRAKRILRPAVEVVRRRRARFLLALEAGLRGHATQAALGQRLELSAFNALGPPALPSLVSRVCSAREIQSSGYSEWCARLADVPRFHRKQWEHVVILEAARLAGQLRAGARAIGFGVGTEPLPAALAAQGVHVLATDQPTSSAAHWTSSNEHSNGVEALMRTDICPESTFRRLMSFRPVDMNRLPPDLAPADVVWSACVIEHLGSPQAGMDFVKRSLKLLNPGGVAVHTTELDLTPGDETMDYGHCAVYRLQDLALLEKEVRAAGFWMELNPYVAMEHPADRSVAPPYSRGTEPQHLKLALYKSITTSIALIIVAPGPL